MTGRPKCENCGHEIAPLDQPGDVHFQRVLVGDCLDCPACDEQAKQPVRPETTQHGHEIVKDKYIPGDHFQRNGWIIVAKLADTSYHPWVTWWMDEQGNCQGGHYFFTREEAEIDLEGRS